METSGPAETPDADERYRRALAHAVLRGVVHDLNNPLATVSMAASALRSTQDEAQRAELVDIVEREAMRAGALATAAASAYAATPAPLETTPLAALVTAVDERCRADGLVIDVHLSGSADTRVTIDPDLLPRTLAALIADADRAPGRSSAVRVVLAVDGEELTITIDDDGHPMTEAVARQPFRPFVDGRHDGRGVGLAVAAARSHVRSRGGSITVSSSAQSGTTIVVRMSVAVPAPAADRLAEPTGAGHEIHRALVIDDSEPMRKLLSLSLRRAGWEVATAADGAAAEAVLESVPVAVILLDLHLGAERGPEIAARLERTQPGSGQRIVYLTGDAPSSGQIDGRPALEKPFTLEHLHRVISEVAAQG